MRDTVIVMAGALLLSLPYLGTLGFYNDDWVFFARYSGTADKGLWSFVLAPIEPTRPASAAYHALLYWLFGNHPLGYHVTNAIVYMASAGLFHTVLRRLDVPAHHAFASAMVWATLPHAATGRFWYAIFQMQASIAFALAAVACELESHRRHRWRWRSLAVICVVASGLFYEVALPVLAFTPLIVAGSSRRRRQSNTTGDRFWWLVYPLIAMLLLAMKLASTDRLEAGTPAALMPWLWGNLGTVFGAPSEAAVWGFNVWRALHIAFVDMGIWLPRNAWESAVALGPGLETGIAAALAIATFVRLSSGQTGDSRSGVTYAAAGLLVFLLGWSVFLGTSQIQQTPTGIGNRTGGAASIGVALVFIGVIQFLSRLVTRRLARSLFALATAAVVASGTLVIHRIAGDWARAWAKEQEILAQIRTRFPDGFAGRALMLDGVCQYVGPATVFEASWDLQWALQARYADPSIRADVVTSSLEIRESDLRTTLYGEERLYKYGSVVVYRPTADVIDVLESADDARAYFEKWNVDRDSGCPPGRIGHGVDVFSRRPDVAYVSGFYDVERNGSGREWRWMDSLGIISLRNGTHDMVLTIQGRAPEQLTQSPTITIQLNGVVLDTIRGDQPVDIRFTVPAAAQRDGPFSELRIRSDQVFVPRLADPASLDRRRLGFVLYRLTWTPR